MPQAPDVISRDDVLRMARDSGLSKFVWLEPSEGGCLDDEREALERFAALVAAAERERIASEVAEYHDNYIAAAIRARTGDLK